MRIKSLFIFLRSFSILTLVLTIFVSQAGNSGGVISKPGSYEEDKWGFYTRPDSSGQTFNTTYFLSVYRGRNPKGKKVGFINYITDSRVKRAFEKHMANRSSNGTIIIDGYDYDFKKMTRLRPLGSSAPRVTEYLELNAYADDSDSGSD